jgi:two-component system, cell cycle sensor histidine kinase and response regulator CckA
MNWEGDDDPHRLGERPSKSAAPGETSGQAAVHRLSLWLQRWGLSVSSSPGCEVPHHFTRAAGGSVTYYAPSKLPQEVHDCIEFALDEADDRGRLERSVEQLEERVHLLSEGSFEGYFIHKDGIITYANDCVVEMLRTTRDQLIGFNALDACVAPEDRPMVRERLAKQLEGKYLIHAVRMDGSRFRAEIAAKDVRTSHSRLRVVGVRDVTEREANLALLRESEERLRQLVDAMFDITILSQNGIIVEASGELNKFDLSREQMLGRAVFDFVPPSEVNRIARAFEVSRVGPYETVLQTLEGALIPIQVVGVYSHLNGVPTRVSGLRDLRPMKRLEAERHRLETQMERAQRLDTVGVLAGGIAHDFNNLLVGVLGNADLLLTLIQKPDERELLSAIVSASRQARDLATRLLAYGGRGKIAADVTLRVDVLVSDILRIHSFERSRGVRVHHEFGPETVVRGDRATLTQVLLNLVSNAVDACQESRGAVTIRARRIDTPDQRWNHAVGATVGPGDWVLLEVEDTGVGMDEATVARIFEPFFSTKAAGHGLGLAACLGIVQAHGGALHVRTEPGHGSCFSILLPACADSSSVPASAPKNPPLTAPILVTDDEPLVRRQLRRTLELQGYTTLEAEDGPTCLRLLENVEPGLLILDVTMPGMSGIEVTREVRRRGLTVPILLTSGYIEETLQDELVGAPVDEFLAKPYSVEELLGAVERALSSTAPLSMGE